MTIEIHQPELVGLIQEHMQTGRFQSVEDVLLRALESWHGDQAAGLMAEPKKNFTQFLLESPLAGSGLELDRIQDYPCPIEL